MSCNFAFIFSQRFFQKMNIFENRYYKLIKTPHYGMGIIFLTKVLPILLKTRLKGHAYRF